MPWLSSFMEGLIEETGLSGRYLPALSLVMSPLRRMDVSSLKRDGEGFISIWGTHVGDQTKEGTLMVICVM